MKKALFILVLSIAGMSCSSKKEKMLSEAEIHAKADSLVGVKLIDINRQAMEDLDHRMAIEVKAKADSIFEARTRTANDTSRKK